MVRGMFAHTLGWEMQELGVALASALNDQGVSKRWRHPEIANGGVGSWMGWNSRLNMD